jgi:ferredoxin
MNQFKVTLWPSGEVLEFNEEETLLQQLKKSGKKIKSSCGGCATCSDCTIIVKSGEMNLTPQTFEELRLLGNVFHITKERLSCQTKITGDVTLDITLHEKNTFTGKMRSLVWFRAKKAPKLFLKSV